MKEFNLKLKYYIYDVPNHKEHKENILSLIEKIPSEGYYTDNCNLDFTDWNLPREVKREYLGYFYHKIAKDYTQWFCKKYNLTKYSIHNGWYQQYLEGHFHNYHSHPNCNFTNIYFVETPEKEMITDILDADGKKINLKCKEGQIISFPAFLLHRSKPNNTKSRKTIISFNSSFVKD
jgi:cupin superfamily acireductone dioxygenase involved in methionine salvage